MYIPLGVKTDYSLLKSLIRIPEFIKYLIEKAKINLDLPEIIKPNDIVLTIGAGTITKLSDLL
mgnify:CR=1 FL=1